MITAVYDLHLNTIALLAIHTQLIGSGTNTHKRSSSVTASMSTVRTARLALINVFTGLGIFSQLITWTTLTAGLISIPEALLRTATVTLCTRVLQFAVFPVLVECVIASTAALEMTRRQLDAEMLTATVPNTAGVDGDACASVHMQSRSSVTLAVIRAPGVHTHVLAAAVMHLAFVNILAGLAVLLELLTCGTLTVEAADSVTAQSFTASVGLFTLVHVILAARTTEAGRTVTELSRSFSTLTSIKAHAITANRIQASGLPVELGPS